MFCLQFILSCGCPAKAPASLPSSYTVDYSDNFDGTSGTTGATSYTWNASHKYVKIETASAPAGLNYTLYYNSADGKMYKEQGYTNEVTDVPGWSPDTDKSILILNGINFSTQGNRMKKFTVKWTKTQNSLKFNKI